MELYTLNSDFERDSIFDRYESLIWSERFSSYGDFKMVIFADTTTRSAFQRDVPVMVNVSKRVMIITTITEDHDADGNKKLTVTGLSLEAWLQSRTARNNMLGSTANTGWVITDVPAAIARKIFNDVCVTGVLDPGDKLPYYTAGNLYPTDTLLEPTDTPTATITNQSVYDAIKQICDQYLLGFRLYYDVWNKKLYFNVYAGSDRTTSQTNFDPVVFSQQFESLTDTSILKSSEDYKNVAYVIAPNGTRIVYAPEADSTTSGFDRRVLYVQADDITLAAGTALDNALDQRGKSELSQHRTLTALDGEVPKSSSYIYEVNYYCGDVVEMQDDSGTANRMRVTEQIFTDDTDGEKSYPTLAVETLITPGSWQYYLYAVPWTAITGAWQDQPSS